MQKTDWNGYDRLEFEVDGRSSVLILPKTFGKGCQWVWRAEFLGAFDIVDRALLADGWAIAYHKVSDMYGCPESIDMMKVFYDYMIKEYDLSAHPVLFGFSRGGLYTVNFAAKYPEIARCIYIDAPVLDMNTWPRMNSPREWQQLLDCYHVTEDTLDTVPQPLDKAECLVKNGTAVMLVAGAVDTLVPYDGNGKIFAERYQALGGTISVIVKPDCDHHPHSVEDPAPVVEFIKKHNPQ